MLPPVVKTITVPCPPERAFAIFTRDFSVWWPADKHSMSAMAGRPARSVHAEAKTGGEIWEIDHKGDRQIWGQFTTFQAPSLLEINWHVGRPKTQATRVAVQFTAKGAATEVTLTHSGWEIFAQEAENMRNGYNNGWVHVFETCFKSACNTAPT